jgi:hypothetical protein
VRTLEPTGKFSQEEIDAKLSQERERRKARAERFGVEYKEPTVVCLVLRVYTDILKEELFQDGFVSKKRYHGMVQSVECSGNLYVNQQVLLYCAGTKRKRKRKKKYKKEARDSPHPLMNHSPRKRKNFPVSKDT